MNTLATLPDALCFRLLCPLFSLQERLYALARVSRRWERLALSSLHGEPTIDLTWCTGDYQLEYVIETLIAQRPGSFPSRVEALRLYGPRVSSSVLTTLFHGVGVAQIKCVELESKHIDDAALSELRQCTRLTHLSLHCVKLTDDALITIARSCPHLHYVDLSGCSRVCDAGVVAIANNCSALSDLNLCMCHRITDHSIVALAARTVKSIERVIVDRCLKISGMALRYLMKSQPQLTCLSFANCPKVCDSDFAALGKQLSQRSLALQHLDMSGCASVGDDGVKAMVTCHASSLHSLYLRSLLALSSSAYSVLPRCSQLRMLDLSMCRSLQNHDLQRILAACRRLETLLLMGCVGIDDVGAQAIADYGTAVRRLSLEFCYNITDTGLVAIVAACAWLADLSVKALNQLTAHAFRDLVHRKPERGAQLQRINIGACADFETSLMYSSILKSRYPAARIEWT